MSSLEYSRKRLAILGASKFQVPLIEKANSLGCETHVFASGNIEGKEAAHSFHEISVLDTASVLSKCREISVNGICSIGSDVVVETWLAVAHELKLTADDPDIVPFVRNKLDMAGCLESRVKVPRYFGSNTSISRPPFTFPMVVRPVDLWGSKGVRLVVDQNNLLKAIEFAKSASLQNDYIVSEYIEGKEYSVEMISWEGQHYPLAITAKQTNGPPYFVELEHHMPSGLNDEECRIIFEQCADALDALKHTTGASHTEIIVKDKDIYFTEVAARMGGDFIGSHLVEAFTSFDYLKAVIDISLGNFTEPIIESKGYTGVIFAHPGNSGLVALNRGKNMIPNEILASKFDLNEQNLEFKESSERASYIIYKSTHPFQLP